ncbi:hypothetical protein ADL33_32850 [Streptomyces sp. NRRL WC-3604]|nr:hypothetical protein ADL33_32850 [Streptomyces sp. NRRL WC-3604]
MGVVSFQPWVPRSASMAANCRRALAAVASEAPVASSDDQVTTQGDSRAARAATFCSLCVAAAPAEWRGFGKPASVSPSGRPAATTAASIS